MYIQAYNVVAVADLHLIKESNAVLVPTLDSNPVRNFMSTECFRTPSLFPSAAALMICYNKHALKITLWLFSTIDTQSHADGGIMNKLVTNTNCVYLYIDVCKTLVKTSSRTKVQQRNLYIKSWHTEPVFLYWATSFNVRLNAQWQLIRTTKRGDSIPCVFGGHTGSWTSWGLFACTEIQRALSGREPECSYKSEK